MSQFPSGHDENDESFDALTPFDIRCLRPNDLFLVLGDDHILADAVIASICQRLQPQITFVNVFTSLDIDSLSYEAYIPQSCIFKNTDCGMLVRFLQHQKNMIQKCIHTTTPRIDPSTRQAIQQTCHTLLILDRCPPKWLNHEEVKRAVELANHLQLTIIIRTAESVSKIPAIITTKTDFCFTFSTSVGGEHNKLYNALGGMAPQGKDFRKLLQANTQAHQHCMVVDRRKRSYAVRKTSDLIDGDDVSAMIPWMQAFARYSLHAHTITKFRRMGCPALWSLNDAAADTSVLAEPSKNVYVGDIPTLLDVLQNYGRCAEDERIQITVEIVKKGNNQDKEPAEPDQDRTNTKVQTWLADVGSVV